MPVEYLGSSSLCVFPFSSLELLNLELLNLHLMYSMAIHPTAITDVKPLQSSNSDTESPVSKK